MLDDFGLKKENGSKNVFFCGIGGVSMSGLAVMLKSLGYTVSGSDASPKEHVIKLCREHKIPLFFSHSAENIAGCDLVIYSSAIASDNCELCEARRLGIPIMKRSKLLGAISGSFANSIAIAGTHGKSTVTGMLYEALIVCGRSPYLLCGARLQKNGLTYALGGEELIIYEACEYDRSFLDFTPKTAVILNIEREHTDTYPTLSDAEEAYFEFASKSDTVILNYDNASCQMLGKRLLAMGKRVRFFSLNGTRGAFFVKNIREHKGYFSFNAGDNTQEISLGIPGAHNVSNALAVALTCNTLGITDFEKIAYGISNFKGVKRRFEHIGALNGADVYDDYAHHPTEIKATLSFVKKLGYSKVICVFQAHTYSRTRAFFDDFAVALEGCDEVIIAPIYAAREKNDGICYEKLLADKISNGKFIENKLDILKYLAKKCELGTLILTMGAGELDEIATELANMEGFN